MNYYNFAGSLCDIGYSGHILLGTSDGSSGVALDLLRSHYFSIEIRGGGRERIFREHIRPCTILPIDWIENSMSCTKEIMLTFFIDVYFQAGEKYKIAHRQPFRYCSSKQKNTFCSANIH